MIELRTTRQCLEAAKRYFFPYILEFRQSRLNNVGHHDHESEPYLAAIMFNCLLEEVDQLFVRKLVNTTGAKIRIPLTDAQAVVFYQSLKTLPLPADQYWLNTLRNEWILALNKQLIEKHLLRSKGQPAITSDFEDDDWI